MTMTITHIGTAQRGGTLVINVPVTAGDATGYTPRAALKVLANVTQLPLPTVPEAAVSEASVVVLGSDTVFQCVFSAAQTAALEAGQYVFDCRATNAATGVVNISAPVRLTLDNPVTGAGA